MLRPVVAQGVSLRGTAEVIVSGVHSGSNDPCSPWHIRVGMIGNDNELAVTWERVATFARMLEELRKTARAEEWRELSSGYRLEIERMQSEISDYLVSSSRT